MLVIAKVGNVDVLDMTERYFGVSVGFGYKMPESL